MSLKLKVLICFAAIVAMVLPWPLLAGVCAQRAVVKQRVVSYSYSQPVYKAVAYQQVAHSPYQYAIGSDLVLEALAEKLAVRIEEKLRAQQRVDAPVSIVAEKCARCHVSRSKAVVELDAPVFFDDLGNLTATAEQRASMKTAVFFGNMPPPPAKPLTDEEFVHAKLELEQGIVRPIEQHRAPREAGSPPWTKEELEWLQRRRQEHGAPPAPVEQ